MNKKLLALLLAGSMLLAASCEDDYEVEEKAESTVTTTFAVETMPVAPVESLVTTESMQPDIVQIRNICELATYRVYFHNVAKAVKPRSSGLSGIGESDRQFWFEYSGYVDLGVDMSRVAMTIEGDVVTVTMPDVGPIGGVNVDSSSYDFNSVIIEGEHWYNVINPNEITATDLTNAINDTNTDTMFSILSDNTIMMTAQQRAEELIENYIQLVGKYSDTHFTVVFEHVSES
ncbi:MAG: DUF4230 domain-containing protein [Saccharofermentans sp.]|nr:DUF4230 domain-containing protein [Saccharofermentans sp.]